MGYDHLITSPNTLLHKGRTLDTPKRLGILFSGGATTAQAVVRACFPEGELTGWQVPVVAIASTPKAGGIENLRKLGVPVEVADFRELGPQWKWGGRVAGIYQDYKVDVSAQLGLIPRVSRRVLDSVSISINQHPARLDRQFGGSGEDRMDFGGQGMMGSTALAATLIYTCLTGDNPWLTSTTHLATTEVDGGKVLREVHVSVDPLRRLGLDWNPVIMSIGSLRDRADELIALTKECQAELLPHEHLNVIQTLKALARGRVPEVTRSSPLIPKDQAEVIQWARNYAKKLFPN